MSIDITTLALAKEYTNRMVGSGGTGCGVNGKDGITPHIGDNGNWFIGTVDTGISAQGPAGENGVTPHIGTNGNWYIGSVNTGVSAKGAKGDNGLDGNGIKSAILNSDYTLTLTFDDGTTYTTPSIRGATGVPGSAGKDGTDGVGIASIKQTATSTTDGGNNVFAVTLTNGTSATFTVKNGSKGSTGNDGSNGADGGHYTPIVTQPTSDTMQISFTPSRSDMPAVNPVTVNLPVSEGSGQNANGITPDGRVIDLKKYGITAVDYEPPFTEEMYHVAYANGTGIQQAIDDAKAVGMTDVILPAGRYPVCYHASADDERNPIVNIKGVNLFAAGVTLYVIYDEEGNNPYFTGETPRLLQGSVTETDSDVYGLHCIGERAYRVENAQYREFSSGIELNAGCNGNTIDNCICEYFSGDGFGAGTHMEQFGGWPGSVWTATAWNGTEFVYDEYKYTSEMHGASWIDQTRPIWMRVQEYNLWTYQQPTIHCFAADGGYLGKVKFWQGEYFYFLPGTDKWCLEIKFGSPHAEDSVVHYDVWLGYGFYNGTILRNCIARYNTRGGMSNLPNNAHLIDCTMHHNGCAWDGMPGFYDGTQFGLDIEDIYINNITLERCNIYGNLHGVLWRCRNIKFIDCTIEGYTKSLNYCGGFHAEHTKFLSGLTLDGAAPYGRKIAIGCEFAGTIPKEIVVLDDVAKIPASAVLIGDKRSVLELRNAAGETVMSVDLTYLGKRLGEEIVQDMLMFDMDFTKFTEDSRTMDDTTGNASVTVPADAAITGYGIGVAGYGKPVQATWKEGTSFNGEFCLEMTCFGRPNNPIAGPAGGIFAPAAQKGTPLMNTTGYPTQHTLSQKYITTAGETVVAVMETDFPKATTDAGEQKYISDANFPGRSLTRVEHLVANYKADGTVDVYVNGLKVTGSGHPDRSKMYAEDFASWDMSYYAAGFNFWGGATNEKQILRSIRWYNRCLTPDEVASNMLYELNQIGTVWRVYTTLKNATVDNVPTITGDGKPYTATVTANDGYTLEGATVTVTMGDVDITETAYADGAINIEAMTGDVTITVTAVAMYAVTNTLTNVTSGNSDAYVMPNAAYSATLTADEGYTLSSVNVTMGGTDVTDTVYADGVITIEAVTGALVVTATAEAAA